MPLVTAMPLARPVQPEGAAKCASLSTHKSDQAFIRQERTAWRWQRGNRLRASDAR